jgi:hypothetical protein
MQTQTQTQHRRNRTRRNGILVVMALVVGGGSAALINAAANAANSSPGTGAGTAISCPDVKGSLPAVPSQAQSEVDRDLRLLQTQIDEATKRLAATQGQGGTGFVNNSVLGPLKDKRTATLDRIATAIGRNAARPQGLDAFAACTLSGSGAGQRSAPSTSASASPSAGSGGSAAAAANGPSPDDFVDITKVQPNVKKVRNQAGASTGTFASRCGVNKEGQHNSDNVIVAPGVVDGAHHVHDYVGNKQVDGNSTNESLAAQGTTCTNGDQSAYYWPVLRDLTKQGPDAGAQGGGAEGNVGAILVPRTSSIVFAGSPTGKVVAMPRFLRIITGDAKAVTNGTANANAHWSCTGFENKVQLTDKYPLCPSGSKVVRSFAFQSCWDGANTDSANHRDHVAFTDANGNCPGGFKAIPQLTARLTYSVPAGTTYAVDGFQDQQHKAITDHDDFINAMTDQLMAQAVDCINTGRRCG